MTQITKVMPLEEVLGRALRDRHFRQKLTANPRAVATEAGIAAEAVAIIAAGILSIGPIDKRKA
jgi:hypothetical protein